MLRVIITCCLAVTIQGIFISQEDDPGFDIYFGSNDRELQDVEIFFDKPLPSWLKGTLIRNGLGKFEVGKRRFTHSFDAFAKLCSWKFLSNGSVFFSTKFLQSGTYKESIAKNDIAPYMLFETVDPPFNEFQRMEALVRGLDNMNVNVYKFDDDGIVALNDFWKVYTVEPYSLNTTNSVTAPLPTGGHSSWFGFLSLISSAHPLPEMGTSHHLTFVGSISLVPGIKNKINLIRIKSTEIRELIAVIDVDRLPYMHSFSVTKQYVIFFACPFYFDISKFLRYAEPFKSLDWEPHIPTTLYIVNIKTGEVTTLKTDSVFMMHQINAFEKDESNIIVDISSYPDPSSIKAFEMMTVLDPMKRKKVNIKADVRRYYINLQKKSVKWKTFSSPSTAPCASNLDMPAINENFRYKNYCYAYGIVFKCNNISLSSIAVVKKDLCSNDGDKMWILPYHYPVEPRFIPAPEAKSEDDGYLMLPIFDGDLKKSYLAMIDAKTMKLSHKSYLPTIVPFNTHGQFFHELV